MGKFVAGFVAGVAVTSLTVFFFAGQGEVGVRRPSVLEGPVVLEVPADVAKRAATEEVTPPPRTTAATDSRSAPTLALLERQLREANQASMVAAEEFERARTIERWKSEPPPLLPIVLPREFDWLAEDPDNAHEIIQREPIDPAWSAVTESDLHRFFAQQPAITAKYGTPTINCRTNRCEIAFVTYGLEADTYSAPGGSTEFSKEMTFKRDLSELYNQSWAVQFGFVPNNPNNRGISVTVRSRENATTILWHLLKQD